MLVVKLQNRESSKRNEGRIITLFSAELFHADNVGDLKKATQIIQGSKSGLSLCYDKDEVGVGNFLQELR